jgi:hypothetical protein
MCSFSAGQDSSSKIQVFGGYSWQRADIGMDGEILDPVFRTPTGTFRGPSAFNGLDTQIQYNANRTFGFAADFGGNYGSPFNTAGGKGVSGLPSGSSISFLVGPVVSSHAKHSTLFLHGLLGLNRLHSSSTSTLTGTTFHALPSVSDTTFAMALGGGLDYDASPHFGVRLGQFDYLYTAHNMDIFANKLFGPGTFNNLAAHQDNFRIATGVVFHF